MQEKSITCSPLVKADQEQHWSHLWSHGQLGCLLLLLHFLCTPSADYSCQHAEWLGTIWHKGFGSAIYCTCISPLEYFGGILVNQDSGRLRDRNCHTQDRDSKIMMFKQCKKSHFSYNMFKVLRRYPCSDPWCYSEMLAFAYDSPMKGKSHQSLITHLYQVKLLSINKYCSTLHSSKRGERFAKQDPRYPIQKILASTLFVFKSHFNSTFT